MGTPNGDVGGSKKTLLVNSKSYTRNPRQYQMTKTQIFKTVFDFEHLYFEFVSSFDILISDL